MNKQRILFRADGNRSIGLGHISRCLALAEILSEKFEIEFATRAHEDHILNDLDRRCNKVICLPEPKHHLDAENELIPHLDGSEIVVLDGYSFSTQYEQVIKKHAAAVVTIDDIPNRHFVADIIINFCGLVKSTDYSKEFYAQVYSGLGYLFLRSPFLRTISIRKKHGKKLLINMGGADPENQTQRILTEVIEAGFSGEIEIIVGQSYPFKKSLELQLALHPYIICKHGLTAEQMFTTMVDCAIAILPPSTVALEYLSTGGILFLNEIAENQRCIKEYLLQEKLAFDYSDFASLLKQQQKNDTGISPPSTLERIFDGSSITRVENLFNSVSLSSKMKFRKATADDALLSFNWVNDPEVRKFSYTKSAFTFESHIQWFAKRMADKSCEYYIAEIADKPLGQIRFDLAPKEEEETYIISYLLDKYWRGKGLGTCLLVKGIQKLRESRPARMIIGYVQNPNLASIKAFERAGFIGSVSLEYSESVRFELLLTKYD